MQNKDRTKATFVPPIAMSDHLWPDSYKRKKTSSKILELFLQHGFEFISTPVYEYAEVFDNGPSYTDKEDHFRFVEPETGQVAILRPDITPQIARVVSTGLHARPSPWKICYEGHVFRKSTFRSSRSRQSLQVGIEYMGSAGKGASVEMDIDTLLLAAKACKTAGLENFKIEIGHAAIAKQVLKDINPELKPRLNKALLQKDISAFAQLSKDKQADEATMEKLASLCEMHGDTSVLQKAKSVFSDPELEKPFHEVQFLVEQLGKLGLKNSLLLDLGEIRGQSYYTGIQFQILADGPGAPIGSGGRYDKLLSRFGMNEPAIGFALDVDNLIWAIEKSQTHPTKQLPTTHGTRVLFIQHEHEKEKSILAYLRKEGLFTNNIHSSFEDGKHYALSWGYPWIVTPHLDQIELFELTSKKKFSFALDEPHQIIHHINALQNQ